MEDGHRFASWSRVGILKEIVWDRRSGDEVSKSLGRGGAGMKEGEIQAEKIEEGEKGEKGEEGEKGEQAVERAKSTTLGRTSVVR